MVDGERRLELGGTKRRSVLAILLLNAGEPVSLDRLVEGVWGAAPPEDAATALHQHVSRLRKALGAGHIETRAPGYVMDPDEERFDLRRFRRAVREGEEALAAGRPDEAGKILRDALGSWRGRPLADLENEAFAAEAIARLEEMWVAAVEVRIDADLAAGRDAELVGELRALVRHHPYRERLRAQLMLALYRSGRQAEALDEYAAARRILVGEVGLEPGPELQRLQAAILTQDESLERGHAARAAPAAGVKGRPRRTWLVAAAAAVAAAATALAGAALVGRSGGAAAESPDGGRVLAVGAHTGRIVDSLPGGRAPIAVAAGGGSAWVVDGEARTVLRVHRKSGDVETLATGGTPADVAVAAGAVWIGNGRPRADAQFVGPVVASVVRLDDATRTQRAEVELPAAEGAVSNAADNRLAAWGDAVWAVTAGFDVARIDRHSASVTAVGREVRALAVAAGPAGVWVVATEAGVARLDERTARPLRRTRLPAAELTAVAVGEEAAWVTSSTDGTLWRVPAGGGRQEGSIVLGPGVTDVAVGGGSVWVVNPVRGTLVQVDEETSEVVRTIAVGGVPRSVAVDGDTVWVAVSPGPAASQEQVAGVRALPSSFCEPVVSGGGDADLLVVSDLPLQGGIRVTATQMARAVELVLRERSFRAGRFRVAYQSCDDSLARTGLFDEAKCQSNAQTYARNPDVLGVIGPLNSPCALAALPTLNSARGGPVPIVSPLNSFVGLTRSGPGVPPSLPAELYPTGRRNYVRVHPTDDLQGAALALLARDRGRSRVFVLDDAEPGYGVLMATGFETAARRLGLQVVGRRSWDPQARSYEELAERVARTGAEAVFLGGLLDSNAAAVVRALRSRLGRGVDLLGPDGLTPLPLLVEQAGRAAIGVYVSLGGLVTERLPPAGAAFVRRFAQTQAGAEVEPGAVYAAQAAEVLLDAIARSDGTRASVVRELFRTQVRGGLLGTFSFDANGDISESPVTVLRVRAGGSSRRLLESEGGEIAAVLRPSPSLVAPKATSSSAE